MKKLILFVVVFNATIISNAQLNNIVNNTTNDHCFNNPIITWGQALPLGFYPRVWYNVNPYSSGTVYSNNVGYDLVFEDVFSGTTNDLLKKWNMQMYNRGTKQNGYNSSTGQYSIAPGIISYGYNLNDPLQNTIEITQNGTLKLWTRQIPTTNFNCIDYLNPGDNLSDGYPNSRPFDYVGAELWSIRTFKHGYFEARVKIPNPDIVWPAFWLWNGRSEIDIFEFNSESTYDGNCQFQDVIDNEAGNKMHMTIHDWNYTGIGTHHCRGTTALARNENNFYFPNQWHTYGLYWDEFKLVWYVDGIPIYYLFKYYKEQQSLDGTAFWEASQGIWDYQDLISNVNNNIPLYTNLGFPIEECRVIFGMQVKNFGGVYSDLNDQTCAPNLNSLPKNMEVDWIRVYANRSCESSYATCYEEHLPTNIAADVVELPAGDGTNCNVTVQCYRPDFINNNNYWPPEQQRHGNQHVEVVANNYAKYNPGFKVERGAYFKTRVENCYGADLRTMEDTSSIYINQLLNNAFLDYTVSQDLNLLSTENYLDLKSKLIVSPNPFNNQITINSSFTNFTKIELLDFTGRIITVFPSGNFPLELNLSGLSEGIYFVNVYSLDKMLSQKIIKTNY